MRRIRLTNSGALARVLKIIDKRTNVKTPSGIHEMERSGWRKRPLTVLNRKIVRCKKAGKQNQSLEYYQQDQCRHEFLPVRQVIIPIEFLGRRR